MPKTLAGQDLLNAALKDAVLAPGKRLRPILTVLTAEDLGGNAEAAVAAGCAVELVHAASLVLDDMPCMDDALLRRSRPAIHVAFGEDLALLSAMAMLSGAYQVLAEIEALPAPARLEAITILSAAVGPHGLIGGQFADLREGRYGRKVPEIAFANGLKTGSLLAAAVEIGGVVAGVTDQTKSGLRAFALELGQAFQLLDDLLDVGSSTVMVGKDVGQDEGKSTIVSIIGKSAVERQIQGHIAAAHGRLTEIFGPGSRLHALVDLIIDQAGAGGGIAAEEMRDKTGQGTG
ncbi:polyprenyl synthetase family protein [Consotaella salsifontis]|uniref:Probable farnesyl diphosphate synthase n=1 Tax=Consotaella salsifontis TaxID=1365950 RepID=A0A1T4L8P7_9HYPH|nr:polyprenyl synthetase family protein [Consotaella salsifontis]SJZ50928.1 geranylgeranyl diphosphate synthase, type II [Consotaella salsifontis]